MGEKIVDAHGVSHAYVRGRATLRDVSLGISRGELVAIVGENGSGKTTLARHLNALIPLQAGELRVAGIDAADPSRVWELRRACGMVFITAYNAISGIFRGIGNSRSPFLFVFIAAPSSHCLPHIVSPPH